MKITSFFSPQTCIFQTPFFYKFNPPLTERLEEKIENVALSIAESATTSRSLVDMIEKLEGQKGEVEEQIASAENLSRVSAVTEEVIRSHFEKARELFDSGKLLEIRQLINLFLENVVVYKERVEVLLRVVPGGLAPISYPVAKLVSSR